MVAGGWKKGKTEGAGWWVVVVVEEEEEEEKEEDQEGRDTRKKIKMIGSKWVR